MALVGSIDSGKTVTADNLLHLSGHVRSDQVGLKCMLDTREDEQ